MSDERRRKVLEQALKDKDLLALVPAVVALSFGVLPIRKLGTVLTVACFPRAHREALRLLREVLALEIVAMPVDERALQTALQKAYHGDDDRSPNFPTFAEPDFVRRPGAALALRQEKVEALGETGSRLPAGLVALAAWSYRSCLWNLDHPRVGGALPDLRAHKYELRDSALAWSRGTDGQPRGVGRVGAGRARRRPRPVAQRGQALGPPPRRPRSALRRAPGRGSLASPPAACPT